MPVVSVYKDILDAVVTGISALNLTFTKASVTALIPVQLRKLPEKEETLDSVPLIVVSPHTRPELIRQLSFEDDTGVDVTYFVELVLIFQGGRDLLTNMDLILNYRQQIRRLFQKSPLGGSGTLLNLIYDVRPDLEYVLDRTMLNQNYDYDGLAFWFKAAEPRTN